MAVAPIKTLVATRPKRPIKKTTLQENPPAYIYICNEGKRKRKNKTGKKRNIEKTIEKRENKKEKTRRKRQDKTRKERTRPCPLSHANTCVFLHVCAAWLARFARLLVTLAHQHVLMVSKVSIGGSLVSSFQAFLCTCFRNQRIRKEKIKMEPQNEFRAGTTLAQCGILSLYISLN